MGAWLAAGLLWTCRGLVARVLGVAGETQVAAGEREDDGVVVGFGCAVVVAVGLVERAEADYVVAAQKGVSFYVSSSPYGGIIRIRL